MGLLLQSAFKKKHINISIVWMIDFFVSGKIWDHFEEQQGCQWNPEALAGDLRACLLTGGETERARPGGKGQNIDCHKAKFKTGHIHVHCDIQFNC